MAAVKKVSGATKKKMAPRSTTSSTVGNVKDINSFGVILPEKKFIPPDHVEAYRWFIYGEGGIGKSSLLAEFGERVLFFQWELANSGLSIYGTGFLESWEHGLAYAKKLKASKHSFDAGVFDTAAMAYERCLEYVCRRERFSHPGLMNDFGASWKKVNDEYQSLHNELAGLLDMPIMVVAHDKLVEFEKSTGVKAWKTEPNVSGKCLEWYRSNCDIIGYYHMHKGKRYLQIIGDEFVLAKANPVGHFRTSDGKRIHRIPMGESAEDAYVNLIAAFNNKQDRPFAEFTGEDVTEETARSRRKRHTKKK